MTERASLPQEYIVQTVARKRLVLQADLIDRSVAIPEPGEVFLRADAGLSVSCCRFVPSGNDDFRIHGEVVQ